MFIELNTSRILSVCFTLLLCHTLSGQIKFEKEKRVKSQEVPELAIAFLSQLDFKAKHKWYKEHSQEGTSYEVKFKENRYCYSLEFDASGKFLDMEKEIMFKNLSTNTTTEIKKSLDTIFKKWKIIKIQEQYINPSSVKKSIKLDHASNIKPDNYEIVIKGIRHEEKKYFEVILDAHFDLSTILEIIDRPIQNMEF